MNKLWAIQIVEILFFAIFLYIAWCLAYELTVAARYAPLIFPGEGKTRLALLQQQQVFSMPDVFTLAPRHFWARLHYPATKIEAITRGSIALGGVGTLIAGAVILRKATKPPTPYGDATFGTLKDAGKAKLLKGSGVVLGQLNGVTLRSADEGHILVVGPTRSGKGVGFVLPNLYEWQGSALVLDWKSENFDNSAMHRVAIGQNVYRFAPGSDVSHRYNPLDFIRRDRSMPTDCDTVALFIVKAFDREDIWPKAARLLVGGLIGYVLSSKKTEGERHLRAVARMLVTGDDLSDVLNALIDVEGQDLPRWVIDRFRQFTSQPEKTRGSVLFNLNTALSVWSNDLISSVTQTSDFDLRKLRKEQITIYICCNISESAVFNLLISLLIQQIHDLNMRSLPSKDDKHSILLLLDEFYYAGRMIEVLDKISISAGYGFRMAIVVQSIAQLDENYGRNMRTLAVSSCNVQLVMKVKDEETARYVSGSLGTITHMYKTPMSRPGSGLFSQRTYTPHYIERPLMTPSQVKEMSDDKGLLFVGSAKPMMFSKIKHYKHQPYRKTWISFLNKTPDIPTLPAWVDKKNLIADDKINSKPTIDRENTTSDGTENSEPRLSTPTTVVAESSSASTGPVDPVPQKTADVELNAAAPVLVATVKKPLSLASPIPERREVTSIKRIVFGIDDAIHTDTRVTQELGGHPGSASDHAAFTSTLDAFGEDDPAEAALLRSQKSDARDKVRLIRPAENEEAAPEPASEAPPDSSVASVDAEAIRAEGVSAAGESLLIADLRQAKAATKARPLTLATPDVPSKDDTMSSLIEALNRRKTLQRRSNSKKADTLPDDEQSPNQPSKSKNQ